MSTDTKAPAVDASPASPVRRSGDHMLVCYSCSRQYNGRSLLRHYDTCLTQREASYRKLPRELIPPTPKAPRQQIPGDDAVHEEVMRYNEEAQAVYKEHLAKCPQCSRRFEPDRILVHMRGCKPELTHVSDKPPVEELLKRVYGTDRMVVCYSCGRAYGARSFPFHIGRCLIQRRNNFNLIPKTLRPAEPVPPSTLALPNDNSSLAAIKQYNEEATKIYIQHMAPCPGCSRRFEPDRILVHMRGCCPTWAPKVEEMPDPQQTKAVVTERYIVCYSCGRFYGLSSYSFHIGHCVQYRSLLVSSLPKELQPGASQPPAAPVPGDGATLAQIQEYNSQASKVYIEHMCKCPLCHRRYEPERLTTHMQGCKPTPKPLHLHQHGEDGKSEGITSPGSVVRSSLARAGAELASPSAIRRNLADRFSSDDSSAGASPIIPARHASARPHREVKAPVALSVDTSADAVPAAAAAARLLQSPTVAAGAAIVGGSPQAPKRGAAAAAAGIMRSASAAPVRPTPASVDQAIARRGSAGRARPGAQPAAAAGKGRKAEEEKEALDKLLSSDS